MKFTTLIPNVFYADINVGLRVFVECLRFQIMYDDRGTDKRLCILSKDLLRIHLIQDREYAKKDRPEIRLKTADITEAFTEINQRFPKLFHPNLNTIK